MCKKTVLSFVLTLVIAITSCVQVHATPSSIMKLGSKGPDVIELQSKLADEGYLNKKFVSGFFGPNTEIALKQYQKDNGIEETGVTYSDTLDSLFTQKKLDVGLVIENGEDGSYVKLLQQILCSMGYLESDSVTGHFGDKTEAAVRKFQADNGISATGVVGKQTIEKLNSLASVEKLETDRIYQAGDEDAGVKALQQRLCTLGYLEAKYVTGYYGAITVAAVKKFQKNNQISETGTVATLTLAALNSAAAKTNAEKDGTAESIAKPGTLRYGDTGNSVKTLQQNLKKLGYFSGTATGEFGDVTKAAVIKFQKAYSLTADGIVNSKTQSKITAALSAKNSSSSGSTNTSGSTGVTVSGYNSANMDVIEQALATLTESELDDVKLMAKVIKREVGGSNYKCQLAVGNVIMNRVHSTGASMYDVIYAPHQFSTANSSLPNETYSTSNYYAALEAYMGVKPVGNCMYFCSQSVRYSSWMGKNRTFYCQIGTEVFFL